MEKWFQRQFREHQIFQSQDGPEYKGQGQEELSNFKIKRLVPLGLQCAWAAQYCLASQPPLPAFQWHNSGGPCAAEATLATSIEGIGSILWLPPCEPGKQGCLHLDFKGQGFPAELLAQDPSPGEPQAQEERCCSAVPLSHGSDIAFSMGLKGRVKEGYLQALRFHRVCMKFELAWNLLTPSSSLCLHFGMEMPILCLSWKHIICFVSQIQSWRRVCLRASCTLSVTHIWFRQYLDETLNLILLGWCWTVRAVEMEWVYCACKMDMN